MPRVLKQPQMPKSLKSRRARWEFWIFVVALVTIFGLFAQTRSHIDTDPNRHLQSIGDLYDIRVPNNNRIIHDRLETGR